ncbi:hypothetical protein [Pantoea vagans]|uniref:hypothetical protein n=1 Tax=Pantoea vagans TaxID=470934 RepID=UPI003017877E
MSEFKGTKGIWNFNADDFSVTTKGDSKLPTEVCHVMDNNPYDGVYEEDIANGHLIAAAPELLEALQICAGYLSELDHSSAIYTALMDKVNDAIEKALGQ